MHVRDLASALQAAGHEVTVLSGGTRRLSSATGELACAHRSLPALVRPINPLLDARALRQIRATLADLQPDLLSTHSSKAGWLGRMAARTLGIPTLFTAHGWAFTEGVPQPQRVAYLWAERLVGRLAARIITVSEHDRQLALRHRVAPPDRLITVHNGMPDVEPALRAHPEVDPPKLVMVARFGPQKDHKGLFQALANLRHLHWSLDLVGEGEGREVVERWVQSAGLADRVRFLGARDDVAEILSQAQIFVLVSRWEGLPRSILEAMRAGLPVVASDAGGVREAVDHERTGLLVPRGDVDGLRAALQRLIEAPGLRGVMGVAGRTRYEERFTFDRMLQETLAVYEEVLAEG